MKKNKLEISEMAREIGRRGGEKTKKLYGKEHFRTVGKKGGRPKKEKTD